MIVHLNGQLLPRSEARLDPFDRGFIFGEGIYEGLRAISWSASPTGSRIVGEHLHARRMQKGLDTARIPFDASSINGLSLDLLKANNLTEAFVYWQVTGGTPGSGDAVRSRVPGANTKPTIFGYCSPHPPIASLTEPASKKVIACRDIRWELGWLKSISLMGNVHAAKLAAQSGCDEAILVRGGDPSTLSGGLIAEGLATNVLLALPTPSGGTEIVTPALDSVPILAGVTRDLLLRFEPSIIERPVRFEELARATEVLMVGTTTYVSAITHVDGRPIGTTPGVPGPISRRLHTLLIQNILAGRDMA